MSRPVVALVGALAAAILSGEPRALAKDVRLEWKPIQGAVAYQLQIENGRSVVLRKRVEKTTYSGDLKPGVYSYQIRAIDRIKRPGQWSQPRALVVSGKPPKPQSPEEDETIAQYWPGAGVKFRWSGSEGAVKFAVTVLRGKEVVAREVTDKTEIELKSIPPGNYTWQVTAIQEPSGRAPAALSGRTWESAVSEPQPFRIEARQLASPVPIEPAGVIAPQSDGSLRFRWKPVEGAKAYELALTDAKTGAQRRFVTNNPSYAVNWPGEPSLKWNVRALASHDAVRAPAAIGPQSVANAFQVSRSALFAEGGGYVALSTLLSPYQYNAKYVYPGIVESNSLTLRASGEYWALSSWGGAFAAEQTEFRVSGKSSSRKALEANLKFRFAFSNNKFGWSLSPKAGVEVRDYFQLISSIDPGTEQQYLSDIQSFTVLGGTAGFDLRKQFSEKWSLGLKVSYFYPFSMSDSSGAGRILLKSSAASTRNLSVGLQGLYWLRARLGLGIGGFFEQRSIGFQYPVLGYENGQANEFVYTDAKHLFLSLIYTFGSR